MCINGDTVEHRDVRQAKGREIQNKTLKLMLSPGVEEPELTMPRKDNLIIEMEQR